MPVSQLIDYFNDRIRTQKIRFLPEDPIRSRYGAVEANFGPLRLTSVFQPLVAIASGGRLAVGHQAYLRAIGENHAALPAPEVFASTREAAAIVYLDRLCRTVHMLNFLRRTAACFYTCTPAISWGSPTIMASTSKVSCIAAA